jgi:hypothetical protein
LKKEDLAEALNFVAQAKIGGASAQSLASSAKGYVDREILWALSKLSAESLKTKMDVHGLWPSALSDEPGMQYVGEVLDALRDTVGESKMPDV